MTRLAFAARLAAAASVLLSPASAARTPSADVLSPGLVHHAGRSVGTSDAYATLSNGDRVVFDGTAIWRESDDGTFLLPLGTISSFVFPSFVRADPTETFALVGESSRGNLYRVDLAGAGKTLLANLVFNFDAAFEDTGHALVSAAPCGFGCGSEIHRIDVATGALTQLASVSGPTGPLAVAANGDLWYGLVPDYPMITGSILRWTHAQVTAGGILDEGSAVVVDSGIDPVSSIAFEPVYGHLFAALPVFNGTSRLVEYTPSGQMLGTVLESTEYLSGVEFRRTQGIGSFQAFQPPGVEMRYRGTDYIADTSEVRTIRTKRPRASTSGPGLNAPGPVTFRVDGAHPNATMLVLVGQRAVYDPHETSYDVGTFLFHTGMPLAGIRRLLTVPTDAAGVGTFTFQNSAAMAGTLVLQAWILDANGASVGSSTEAFN